MKINKTYTIPILLGYHKSHKNLGVSVYVEFGKRMAKKIFLMNTKKILPCPVPFWLHYFLNLKNRTKVQNGFEYKKYFSKFTPNNLK